MNIHGQTASQGLGSSPSHSVDRAIGQSNNHNISTKTQANTQANTNTQSKANTSNHISNSEAQKASRQLSSHNAQLLNSQSSLLSNNQSVAKKVTVNSSNQMSAQFNMKTGAASVLGLSASMQHSSVSVALNGASASASASSVTSGPVNHSLNGTNQSVTTNMSLPEAKNTEASLSEQIAPNHENANAEDTNGINEAENADQTEAKADEQVNNQQIAEQEKQAQQEQQKSQQEQEAKHQVEVDAEIVKELSARDAEVKTHEQAHKAVGGSYAQSPQYTYEKGPDGKRYAVEGEVSIDVGVIEGDAQATFNKMQKVYAAAMAPVQPSMADIQVANEAVQKMNEAKKELTAERQEKIISTEDTKQINDLAQHLALYEDQGFTPSYPFNQTNESSGETESQQGQQFTPINIAV